MSPLLEKTNLWMPPPLGAIHTSWCLLFVKLDPSRRAGSSSAITLRLLELSSPPQVISTLRSRHRLKPGSVKLREVLTNRYGRTQWLQQEEAVYFLMGSEGDAALL
ncbi:hypothetical protein TIFTF001_023173 [Ficus carica]|uniref:Uncharacterized protein n=1 Tax=Ficus carica TaxID=3494 RepID=A0AA88AFP4_FICCA|nr:hypothetical protein TIFTF001_023173 [Ficus carica]